MYHRGPDLLLAVAGQPGRVRLTDPWRERVEPVMPETDARISADLLLDVMWEHLIDEARAHASRLSVLSVPAPRAVIDPLGQATTELIGASVLTHHRAQELVNRKQQWIDRWRLHSIVKTCIAGKLSEATQRDAHLAAGLAYEQWVGQAGARWADQVEGIQHFTPLAPEIGRGRWSGRIFCGCAVRAAFVRL